MIGVAISTTGDEHRLGFLETCVEHWCQVLSLGDVGVVTVDGDEAAAKRVESVVYGLSQTSWRPVVYRVGQPFYAGFLGNVRMGVAVNKNTGLELLMDAMVNHVFLCDDDTWPRSREALDIHMAGPAHSMVNWGHGRMNATEWTWPRGVLLYAQPQVLARVGGMDERFGPGGHEHVEWSRRIQQAGLTDETFPAPAVYRSRGGMGAAGYWHAEDMRRPGEPIGNLRLRRRKITSIRRPQSYWVNAEQIMRERDGYPDYVPFRAADNGRASATIPSHSA